MRPVLKKSRIFEALGVHHGFSTAAAGDAKSVVVRDILMREAEIPWPLATARQVHGRAVVWRPGGAIEDEADALLTRPRQAVGVFTADCVPILLVDPEARLAAAVHAGWRGTLSGVITAAVEGLLSAGAKVESLRAALGPRIGACCYTVGEDVAVRFVERFGATVVARAAVPGPKLDLGQAGSRELVHLGLRTDHIEVLAECTACATEQGAPAYFSYRREQTLAGRQLSFVALHA